MVLLPCSLPRSVFLLMFYPLILELILSPILGLSYPWSDTVWLTLPFNPLIFSLILFVTLRCCPHIFISYFYIIFSPHIVLLSFAPLMFPPHTVCHSPFLSYFPFTLRCSSHIFPNVLDFTCVPSCGSAMMFST